MIGRALAAAYGAAQQATPPAGSPRGNVNQAGKCIDCSGSGLLTNASGVCTIDVDCPKCGGTGKPPRQGPKP